MATTSINIQPVKGGSELHNVREKNLSYVRSDLSHLNESWSIDTIENRLKKIQNNYKNSTGQKMQIKATPIREGVVVIDSKTTMQQLQIFTKEVEKRFSIKAIQIHIHRDEGHKGAKEWKSNLHAHVVFDWTQENGKSVKMNRQDMAELQTILSKALSMERGKSSDRKHLDALQFKNEQELKKAQELKTEIKKIELIKSAKGVVLKATEKVGDLIGTTKNSAENKLLMSKNNQLTKMIDHVHSKNKVLEVYNEILNGSNESLKQEITLLERKMTTIGKEIVNFSALLSNEALNYIEKNYPVLEEVVKKAAKQLNNQQHESKNKGMKM